MTECIPAQVVFSFADRPVVVRSDAPEISSDGGWVLLRGVDDRLGLVRDLARSLTDDRDRQKVVHSREEQLRQRVYQIALGYEDCNDAASLRHDPVLRTVCGLRADDDRGLSSQPTLSRFENGMSGVVVGRLLRQLEGHYVASLPPTTTLVTLDVDSTDDRTHGQQQLSMFNGFFDHHVYHPLLVFDADSGQLVSAILRSGRSHASRGARGVLRRLVVAIRRRCPAAQIVVRADSAFSSQRIIAELDRLADRLGQVYYVLGFVKNVALGRLLEPTMQQVRHEQTIWGGKRVRYATFRYRARSWPCSRTMVGKAEYSEQGENPRFVVTNVEGFPADLLYGAYCERGQCENRIKDFKNALIADRLSCTSFRSNFFRLLLHCIAYRLMHALRESIAGISPQLARAQFDTLRLKLLKVAAVVTTSVRRVLLQLPRAFPLRAVYMRAAVELAISPAPS